MNPPLRVIELGRRSYGEVLELQRALVRRRVARELDDDILLLVQHPPVITLGRGTRPSSLPLTREQMEERGLEVFEVERGGDVTHHGPGQMVGYPILDLQQLRPDLHWYLRKLEGGLIDALGTMGIAASRNVGFTGVWSSGRKIASIGIHVKQWITMHGFALNVINDLAWFEAIVPCGIPNVVMTSILQEHHDPGKPEALYAATRRAVVRAMGQTFCRQPEESALEEISPCL